MTGRDIPRHNLRLTPELKKKLAHAAVDNGRSMNAEILARLENSFSPDPATQIAEAIRPIGLLSHDEQEKVIEHLLEITRTLSKVREEAETESPS